MSLTRKLSPTFGPLNVDAYPRLGCLDVPSFDGLDPYRCHISSCFGPRERLFAPEGEAGGGGAGESAPRTFLQADVDRIVQERVGKLKEQIKTLEASQGRLAEIEAKLAEADERETKAREEAELKGKSEVEKLQHQVQKATEAAKARDADWAKKVADSDAGRQAAELKFIDYVKRSAVSDALSGAGLIKGASRDATASFLSEAQIELGDDHQIRSITVGGKSFDKASEAAAHFLSEKPYFAEKAGGSGAPRTFAQGPGGNGQSATLSSLLYQGLSQAGKTGG